MCPVPILPGRVPNSLVASRLNSILQETNRHLTRVQESISTGHKLSLPSDDPYAASKTITLQQLLDRKTQVSTNINTDSAFLMASDSALGSISDSMNQAKTLLMAGIGDSSGTTDRVALAQQMQTLILQATTAANTTFDGRFLFGGSQALATPFTFTADGMVRYNGDQRSINSLIDLGQVLGNNINGNAALSVLSAPVGSNVDPALTLSTSLTDLFGGQGAQLDRFSMTVDTGVPVTQTIDLSGAKTIADVKAVIEAAFTAGDVTVSINAAQNGLSIVPVVGTVTVSDLPGTKTAATLGIVSAATSDITGSDLDPRLSLTTALSALNGGTGIGATTGNGLLIRNGAITKVIDLSAANTVEDVLNLLNDPDLALSAEINADGNGFAVSTRLSGVDFSIGENNGTNATALGLRTLTGSTALSDMNNGVGVPVDAGNPLVITRRDGTTVSVDLSGSITIDDVLTKLNAVDPGHLVASLNTVGNGISLLDDSGVGPLAVASDELSRSLGMAGSDDSGDPMVALAGADTNPLEAKGVLSLMLKMMKALQSGNNAELNRLGPLVDTEIIRLAQSRADVGSRGQVLQSVQSRLKDQQVQIQQSITSNFDTDLTEAITQLVSLQTTFQAALRTASQTLELSLFNYM